MLRSYTPSKKVRLNSKYIKTKYNQNSKAKFFGLFKVLHLIDKQAYKFELPKKYKVYDVFYILLLELNTIRKNIKPMTMRSMSLKVIKIVLSMQRKWKLAIY